MRMLFWLVVFVGLLSGNAYVNQEEFTYKGDDPENITFWKDITREPAGNLRTDTLTDCIFIYVNALGRIAEQVFRLAVVTGKEYDISLTKILKWLLILWIAMFFLRFATGSLPYLGAAAYIIWEWRSKKNKKGGGNHG